VTPAQIAALLAWLTSVTHAPEKLKNEHDNALPGLSVEFDKEVQRVIDAYNKFRGALLP